MFKYVVLHHPTLGYKSIRKNHAPFGFVLSSLWLLYKRIWARGLIFMLVCIAFPVWWQQAFGQNGSWLVPLIIAFYTGFRGNYWYQQKLENQGYEVIAEMEAKSATQALAQAAKKEGSKNDG